MSLKLLRKMRPIKPLKEDFAENWNWNVRLKTNFKKTIWLFGWC